MKLFRRSNEIIYCSKN